MKSGKFVWIILLLMDVCLIISGCGGQNKNHTNISLKEIDEEVAKSNDETIIPAIDYMAEAKKQWAGGNYEEAAIQYKNAYEITGNQQALIEILNMWMEKGNDTEVKKWCNYINTACEKWEDELQAVLKRGQDIQWMITNVTYEWNTSKLHEEEERIVDMEFDEEGNIIRSNISIHGGGIGFLDNDGAYYKYEYLDNNRVKVTIIDLVAEAQDEAKREEELNEMAQNANVTVEQFVNATDDELKKLGYNPEYVNRLITPDTKHYIYTYDENGWIISVEEYRNNELRCNSEYYYDIIYNTELGQGGSNTDKQIRVVENYINDSPRTLYYDRWYSEKKIGMFCLAELENDTYDEYGNLVARSSVTTGITGTQTRHTYRMKYAYCTIDEYLEAKKTGDFSAYRIGTIVSDSEKTNDVKDMVYPFYVYDDKEVDLRCKEYLGEEYTIYEPVFAELVKMSDEPFDGLNENKTDFMMTTDEMNEKGVYSQEGLWGREEALDEYDFLEIGIDEGGNTMGAIAVYFYEGTKVVYRLNTKETSFFVVDYKNHTINDNTEFVDFGGVLGQWLYLVPRVSNKRDVEGYTVYFSYVSNVYYEWD